MTKDEAIKLALEWMEAIVNSNWRNWEELASPEEFERWVKSRANHCAEAIRQALAEKQECETCAAKRKRLTDAGLLKSPLRSDDAIDTSSTCVDENEKREHEPVGTVLNVQWMSSAGGWEIGFHSKRKLFKGEALYTAPQEQGCAECGKKASDGWALYCVKCSEPMREHEPVAWTLTEFLDKRETTTNAPLWFVDPVNSAWTPLYTAPPSKQEPVAWLDQEMDMAYTVNEVADAELRRLHQVNAELVEALKDMLSGWKYIRETHGDLSGVGWDRAQNKAELVLIKLKEQA